MIMSEEIKKIVENAKSEDEFLKNLDKVGHRLSNEELEALSGGYNGCGNSEYFYDLCGNTKMESCPGRQG